MTKTDDPAVGWSHHPATRARGALLLDHFIDLADAVVTVHQVVAAPPAVTFDAARQLDLLEVKTPLLTASFWVRGLPTKDRLQLFGAGLRRAPDTAHV